MSEDQGHTSPSHLNSKPVPPAAAVGQGDGALNAGISQSSVDHTRPATMPVQGTHLSYSQPVAGEASTASKVSPQPSLPAPLSSGAAGRLAGVSPQVSPGSSPVPKLLANNNVKLDHLKDWSVSAFKCTKQMLLEKMGKGTRTVDTELEQQIELLRDTQRKYEDIIRLGRAFCSQFHHVVQTQRALGDAFAELAVKAPELQDEFNVNSETQRALVAAGDTLMAALNFFTSSVNTLVNKTMVDTLDTYRMYEQARLEYDAYRGEYEAVSLQAQQGTSLAARLSETEEQYRQMKARFEKLRNNVTVKLKLLEENKVKVMQKQLVLLHRAVSAYFAGNQEALELALKQFSIKVQSPNSQPPSWLEGITGMH